MKSMRTAAHLVWIGILISGLVLASCAPTPPDDEVYELTISSTEGGQVIEPGEGSFNYPAGTVVELVAEAGEHGHFNNWTGDVDTIADPGSASTTITVDDHYSIAANFIVYYETTKEVTEEEAENIIELTEDRDKLLFEEVTDFVADIELGDVLMSEYPVTGAEYGFLKRVIGVPTLAGTLDEGGAVEIEVEPATLEDVIQQGVISVTQTIPLQDLLNHAMWAEGVEVQHGQAGHWFSYTPAEGVKIDGYLRVTADARVDIETHWWHGIEEFEFIFSPGLELEVTLTVEQDVQWDRKYTIATITGPPIPIYGPVTITPKIELVVGTDGTIAAEFTAGITYDRVYDVGIRYLRNEGWSTISNMHGEGFTLDGPHFTGSAEAQVFAGAVLSGTAGVSYIAEATLRTKLLGNTRATGIIETNPWHWQYDLELYLSAQVFADLELCRIAGIGWESDVWEYPDPPYNLAYGASGRVTTEDDEGLEDVTINFSGDHSSITTDTDGYWSKHLLRGEVDATAEKTGYTFDPPSMAVTGPASNLNFQAFAEPEYTPMVSAGEGHTVGLKSDGTVVAVGDNEYGQCDVGGWTDIIRVAAGYRHTVGLKSDGTVVAVGLNHREQCDVGGWTDITQVAAGIIHTVGLKSDGTVVAVGWNEYGQCDVVGWTDIVRVAAGGYRTVGLKSDGTVVAVGHNDYGQSNVDSWTDIIQVAAGYRHTVGLKSDGTVVAVGSNSSEQLDVGQWSGILDVAAGGYHTVGLECDGSVVATGSNYNGQLAVGGWTDIIQVAAGSSHTVGLKSDGTVVGVGSAFDGRCDTGDWTDIVRVAAGGSHTVGLKSDGTVVAVGNNGSGQCDVGGWMDIIQVAAGSSHTVGLKSDGTAVALGWNGDGQCDVGGWTDIVQVAAGEFHTVGLKSDGTVVAVGASFRWSNVGQCDVEDWTDIVQVAAGGLHTVGLKSDGTVVAAGDNSWGQCDVGGWTGIIQVAAGGLETGPQVMVATERGHTVGLRSDGTVVGVGYSGYEQLDVADWIDIVQVTADGWHTAGLKSDGTAVATGLGGYGQLEVAEWADIIQIATGVHHTVGLRMDGTVVAAGVEVELAKWNLIEAVP